MGGITRGATAFVGAATFGNGESPGYQPIDLAAEASRLALEDAGLRVSDVDGLFISLPLDFLSGIAMAEYLGIRPKVTDNNRVGGSGFLSLSEWAALALESGLCDVALICYGSNQRSNSGKIVSALAHSPVEAPYSPRLPLTAYALAAARHMHQYGTTLEQLAQIAVSARDWANLNPEAFARGPLTIEDCMKSRVVGDPLRVRDCCLVTDGAAAVVMTRADRARDLRREPIHLLGAASATWHKDIANMPDLTVTAAKEAGERALAQAGVGLSDVDVVQLYDAFTMNVVLFLEDLGFCKKGEGGAFVEGGRIGPGGTLPVNTNGGGLSCTHPGMYGLYTLVEAIRQLRHEADGRQVEKADIALCHGNGATLSHQAVNILGRASVL